MINICPTLICVLGEWERGGGGAFKRKDLTVTY